MTTEDKALALAGGLGGATIVAALMVGGALIAERWHTARLCRPKVVA